MSAYNVANCSNQAKWYTEPHYSPQVNNNEAQAGADGPIVACVPVIDIYSRTVFAVHSQYSLSPAGSYNAVLTHAKICAIWAFLDTDQINGPVANCFAERLRVRFAVANSSGTAPTGGEPSITISGS